MLRNMYCKNYWHFNQNISNSISLHKIGRTSIVVNQRKFSVLKKLPSCARKGELDLFRKQILCSQELKYLTRANHTQNDDTNDNRKLPRLMYIQHPLKYLKTKLQFLWLKLFWDKSFREKDFILGTKQAVVLITDLIRKQESIQISTLTTPLGFRQITRDMVLSREDPRLKLIRFRRDDIKKAIPVRVILLKGLQDLDKRFCIVDMFFVGLRNTRDFESSTDVAEIHDILKKYEAHTNVTGKNGPLSPAEQNVLRQMRENSNRVIFAEIFTRFYRECSNDAPNEWLVSFYKIITFDVLILQ